MKKYVLTEEELQEAWVKAIATDSFEEFKALLPSPSEREQPIEEGTLTREQQENLSLFQKGYNEGRKDACKEKRIILEERKKPSEEEIKMLLLDFNKAFEKSTSFTVVNVANDYCNKFIALFNSVNEQKDAETNEAKDANIGQILMAFHNFYLQSRNYVHPHSAEVTIQQFWKSHPEWKDYIYLPSPEVK